MDRAEIRHVAELAELSLTAEEEERMAAEVGRIIAFGKELQGIDTDDVPPTSGIDGSGAWRPEEPLPSLSHEDALAQAPQAEHEGFAVPTFVES